MAKWRQREHWGTTAWKSDYARRPAVEGRFAALKKYFSRMQRGYTHVFGTARNALLVAFVAWACNAAEQRSWYRRHDLKDRWRTFLAEPEPREEKSMRRRPGLNVYTMNRPGSGDCSFS